MDTVFQKHVKRVGERFDLLMSSPVLRYPLGAVAIPKAGVYLFSEGQRHLYVGRADDLRTRLNQHQRESSHASTAAFAARMAREECRIKRDYGPKHKRVIPKNWDSTFSKAKARIRTMNIRVVGEDHPDCQALLEICAAVNLKTPYNDFGNH